tara:strand:- start:3713 stop:3991 length:279 start_codon:yes stop_codon:yes gene_type:complete
MRKGAKKTNRNYPPVSDDIVEIQWIDIVGFVHEETSQWKPAVAWTVGRVFELNTDSGEAPYLLIASSGYNDGDKTADGLAIPLGCIKSWKKV